MTPVKVTLATLGGEERELGVFNQGVVIEGPAETDSDRWCIDVSTRGRIALASVITGLWHAEPDEKTIYDDAPGYERLFVQAINVGEVE